MALDPITSIADLAAKALETIGIIMSKRPDWKQEKKDQYFQQITRLKVLSVMDRRYRDDEELMKCQDELKNFLTAFNGELKK